MTDYPPPLPPTDHIAPAPRRVRGVLANRTVFDTENAVYVWEWPHYPQYYVPVADIDPKLLHDEQRSQRLHRGTARTFGLKVGEVERPNAVRVFGADAIAGLADRARFDWDALDAWFEEDEQIFVHPRDPYSRVDALRSSKHVRVELEGVLLAESDSPVLVFETGLPTRYYLNRTDVRFEHLVPSETRTACPYKGNTSGYWSVRIGPARYEDVAWAYDFPTRQLLPIAGLICFYNEKVDLIVNGRPLARPGTHFS